MSDILVMEHDRSTLETLRDLLSQEGFTCDTFSLEFDPSLDEQTKAIQNSNPYIVLYDLGPPPSQRGLSQWMTLYQTSAGRRYYIILTTDFSIKKEQLPYRHMLLDIIHKPIEIDLISDLVRQALK